MGEKAQLGVFQRSIATLSKHFLIVKSEKSLGWVAILKIKLQQLDAQRKWALIF